MQKKAGKILPKSRISIMHDQRLPNILGGCPLSKLPQRRNVLPKPMPGIQTRVAFSVANHNFQSSTICNKFLSPPKRNTECHALHRMLRVADFFRLSFCRAARSKNTKKSKCLTELNFNYILYIYIYIYKSICYVNFYLACRDLITDIKSN